MGNGFFRTKVGFEYPLLLLILSIAIAIRGGRMSLDCKLGVGIQDRARRRVDPTSTRLRSLTTG